MRKRSGLWMMAVAAFAIFAIIAPIVAAAAPSATIGSDNRSAYPNSNIPLYDKYEAVIDILGVGRAFTDYNPFNPNLTALGSQYYNIKGILVDAIIKTPGGQTQEWPCFWYQAPDGSTSWRMRYAPTAPGQWSYSIRVRYGSDTGTSATKSFTCVAGSQHGFVEINPNDTRFFRHSDGTSFYPLGTDISGYSLGGSAAGVAFPKMKQNGANFTRVFFTSLNIEPYDINKNAGVKSLNNYSMSRATSIDSMMDTARANDIRIMWCLDDWTYIKDAANQYIQLSGRDAPCVDVTGFFTSATAKEIYKRKLRYWAARWGYSTNLLAYDFINETGGGSGCYDWHIEMANYVHSFDEQPHLASGDNGSGELRAATIPYDNAAMDFSQYHDYGKFSQGWTIKASSPNLEKMGSSLEYPWADMSVYAERLARLQWKRYKWMKPLSWNEFGLIYRYTGSSGFPDWDDAYNADPTARHFRDAMWAGMFAGMSVAHWKLDYMVGSTKYAGGDKFWVFKPLANYLVGVEFVGLTQETTYSVADDTNPSPKVTCSNNNIMVVSMHGRQQAYFFAKNLTDVWAKVVSPWSYPGYTPAPLPTTSAQNGIVKIMGLDSGTYIFERWSTTDTNPVTQVKDRATVAVGPDGTATLSVAIGSSDVGFAYKLEKTGGTTPPPPPITGSPSISLTQAADKSAADPGETLTYTITYTNTGATAAASVVVENAIPANTTYVAGSATSGGVYDSVANKIVWSIPSIATGGNGTLKFKVTVN